MEITNKRKGWTLAAFIAGVSIPAAIIGHTVSNGLKATYVTEAHHELVVANAVESHSDHFHIDYNAHNDNTLVLNVDLVLSRFNDTNQGTAPLVMSEEDYIGYEVAGADVELTTAAAYDDAVSKGLAVGAIYAAAGDINNTAPGSAIADKTVFDAIGQVMVTSIVGADTDDSGTEDEFTVSVSEVVGFENGAVVTASFTFSPAEGYTFVRQNPDADNSHAGKEVVGESVFITFT